MGEEDVNGFRSWCGTDFQKDFHHDRDLSGAGLGEGDDVGNAGSCCASGNFFLNHLCSLSQAFLMHHNSSKTTASHRIDITAFTGTLSGRIHIAMKAATKKKNLWVLSGIADGGILRKRTPKSTTYKGDYS